MVRKTKQEAILTRQRLLDAAEIEMQATGVSQTSLARIAKRAGLTRGAVYWHFADKNAVLEAMIARTHLPLRDLRDDLAQHIPRSAPKRLLREMLLQGLHRLANDAQHRRVCEILLHRNEATKGVDSTSSLLMPLFSESHDALVEVCSDIRAEQGSCTTDVLTAEDAADVILAFFCGLYECVLRHGCNKAVQQHPQTKIDALLAGLFPDQTSNAS
ncbi:TetR family transcriptional regulator [Salinisphaera sp. USBA-960]|uniref:TetR family transcriptional regulator n=1 Tax=Salinisphaera orenii TaxID=856731 RepID=UPI000DBE87AA|nr:TetR family transcriptional regulator [Salifodinibacter halophilus]NNC26490.1 TetR family transcriptional regulator [Salifodinibacter halophilus]